MLTNKGLFGFGQNLTSAEGDLTVAPPIYDPKSSIKFDSQNLSHLTWELKASGNRRTWWLSTWFRPGDLNRNQLNVLRMWNDAAATSSFVHLAANRISIKSNPNGVAANADLTWYYKATDRTVFHHLLVKVDTTETTGTRRIRVYMNGKELPLENQTVIPAINTELEFNSTNNLHQMGIRIANGSFSQHFDGCLTEMAFIEDGADMTTDNFGYFDTHGRWLPFDLRESVPRNLWTGNSWYVPCNEAFVSDGSGVELWEGTGQPKHIDYGFAPDLLLVASNVNGDPTDVLMRDLPGKRVLTSSSAAAVTTGTADGWNDTGLVLSSDLGSNHPSINDFHGLALKKGAEYGFDVTIFNGDGIIGRQVPHALGKPPEMVWIKNLDQVSNWVLWHKDLPDGHVINLNANLASSPSDYVIAVGHDAVTVSDSGNVNAAGREMVMLSFGTADDFCKVGSFTAPSTGNHEVDVGFRPVSSLWRAINSTGRAALLFDGNPLIIGTADSVGSWGDTVSLTNNGFRADMLSGVTYLYAAWADTTRLNDVLSSVTTSVKLTPHRMDGHESLTVDNPVNPKGRMIPNARHHSDVVTNAGDRTQLSVSGGGRVGMSTYNKPVTQKTYWEIFFRAASATAELMVGLAADKEVGFNEPGLDRFIAGYYGANGRIYNYRPTSSNFVYGRSYTVNSVIGVLVDPENNNVEYFVNGTSQGVYDYGAFYSGPVHPTVVNGSPTETVTFELTDGEEGFAFPPTANFVPLYQSASYDTAIWQSDKGFKAISYIGTGSTASQNIATIGAAAWETFEVDGTTYALVANHRDASGWLLNSTLYEWNAPRQLMTEIQKIPTIGGHQWKTFEVDGTMYALVANHYNGTSTVVDSVMYRFNPSSRELELVQSLPGTGYLYWVVFVEDNETYVVAASVHRDGDYTSESVLYHFNSGTNQLEHKQNIPTHGCFAVDTFGSNGNIYLVAANHYTGSSWTTDSEVYKWNLATKEFDLIQSFPTIGARVIEIFEEDNETYVFIGNLTDGATYIQDSKLYKWNSTLEELEDIQPIPTVGCSTAVSFIEDGERYLLIGNYFDGTNFNMNSKLYRWDSSTGQLVFSQDILTNGLFDWETFTSEGSRFFLTARFYDGSTYNTQSGLYTWDGLVADNVNLTNDVYVGFKPDLVWLKARAANHAHRLYDSVRGATKAMSSDSTAQEQTIADGLLGFTDDGFLLGSGGASNGAGLFYHGCCWKAGPEFGFDVVEYTGNNPNDGGTNLIPHNLGGEPELVMVKGTESASLWPVYCSYLENPVRELMVLNSDTAVNSAASNYWEGMDSQNLGVNNGMGWLNNIDGEKHIAYLWRSIPGYSRIGVFEGNSLVDGPFIQCGFRPAFVMIKRVDTQHHWYVADERQSPENPVNDSIYWNNAASGETSVSADLLTFMADGFKIDTDAPSRNELGGKYIFMAFAGAPAAHTGPF